MAVLPTLPGLIVRVKVAGQPATEYDPPPGDDHRHDSGDDAEDSTSTRCYIESKSGLLFSVEAEITSDFKLVAPYKVVILRVTIDGDFADSRYGFVVGKKVVRPVTLAVDSIEEPSRIRGQATRRFFTFAPVSAIEDADMLRVKRDAKKADSLGTILAQVSIGFGKVPCKVAKKARSSHDTDTFHLAEKAMKGRELTHGTKFSVGSMGTKAGRSIFKSKRVIGKFSFMYRSRSALQKEMVLPRSRPSSPPTDDCDGLDDMGEKELRKLARDLLRSRSSGTLAGSPFVIKRDLDAEDEKKQARKSKRVKLGVEDLTSD